MTQPTQVESVEALCERLRDGWDEWNGCPLCRVEPCVCGVAPLYREAMDKLRAEAADALSRLSTRAESAERRADAMRDALREACETVAPLAVGLNAEGGKPFAPLARWRALLTTAEPREAGHDD